MELMVTKRADTQSGELVAELAAAHRLEVRAIHAPFLLAAKKVWGDHRGKIDASVAMARELGAMVVVAHLPYLWQWGYARWLRREAEARCEAAGVTLAVENAMLVKAHRPLNLSLYNSLEELAGFPHLVFDTSHFAIAGVDIFRAWERLGERVRHVHLSNNYRKGFDDHALPFEGRLPLDRFLRLIARDGFAGCVSLELGPGPLEARLGEARLVDNLRRSLEFCREHLAAGN
ncbi:MAG: sugar phosphate isomerase/epimerase [Actinobacteria bacterium]|nr:sugar phosphate isomerase/epimerase [Actinomycetota bacterium]